jgi:hypothetical protein
MTKKVKRSVFDYPGNNRLLAIDPGKSGAYALFERNHCTVSLLEWAVVPQSGLLLLRTEFPYAERVVLEKVHSQPLWGAKSSFLFGETYGQIIKAIRFPQAIELLPSQRWKRAMGLFKKTKEDSLALAYSKGLPNDVTDHNMAEAFLMGVYALERQE